MDHDVIIVGGGPAGLAFARSLDGTGLSVAVVERQEEEALAAPPYDGREIALTHRSIRILSELGAWQRLREEEVSSLRAARVLNGGSPRTLTFDTAGRHEQELGKLVSNRDIRRTLFETVRGQAGLTLLAGIGVVGVSGGNGAAEIVLSRGDRLRCRLLVAADSRFSQIRRYLGIAAEVNRLEHTMLVCRMAHELDHDHVATEWFDHNQTIAMLPLNGRVSSAVVTLPHAQAEALAELGEEAFGSEITRRFRGRLGAMRLAGTRHCYPLVTTWSRHFAAPRAALVGDAAVGMHPVTAHGFNLGLTGQDRLAREMKAALARGGDIGAATVLRRYERRHRLVSWPIYRATNLIARLYTDERLPARAARHAVLRLGDRLPLVKREVQAMLLSR